MKTILVIILGILMVSCVDQGQAEKYNYTVLNKSGHEVEFIIFVDNTPNLSKKIKLANNTSINKQETEVIGLTMCDVLFGKFPGYITGISITFDNNRKVFYESCSSSGICNSNSRNIFNDLHNNELTETYTITAEDYQNAVDCGGNCY